MSGTGETRDTGNQRSQADIGGRALFVVLMALYLAGMTAPASAQDPTHVFETGLGSRMLVVQIPPGFVLGAEESSQGQVIAEFVPELQIVWNWNEMVTITTAPIDRATSAQTILERFAAGVEQACHRESWAEHILDMQIEQYDIAAAYYTCPLTPTAKQPVSESFVLTAVVGDAALATLQWAVRAEASESPIPFDDRFWIPRMRIMAFDLKER